jgi:hypothetical protein
MGSIYSDPIFSFGAKWHKSSFMQSVKDELLLFTQAILFFMLNQPLFTRNTTAISA